MTFCLIKVGAYKLIFFNQVCSLDEIAVTQGQDQEVTSRKITILLPPNPQNPQTEKSLLRLCQGSSQVKIALGGFLI